MNNRIQALKANFESNFDGFIIFDQANMQTNQIHMLYLANFLGAAALLVPIEGENVLYVYSVNYEAARNEVKDCRIELVKRGDDLVEKISKQIKTFRLKKLGFDKIDLQTHNKLARMLKNHCKLEAKGEYIWKLRRVKSESEIENMRKAAELTVEGMQTAFECVKAGSHEYEVAAEIEYAMRINGSYGVAFDTIVASGPRSAFPHGGCGEHELKKGNVVVVDIGATYKNYRADMTRTFVVGKSSKKQQKIYSIVKMAQEKAFQKMKEGEKAAEIDVIARNTIAKAGYGEFFAHGLGHGIGLEVHEQPTLSPTSKDILKAGNVVTDEPGIYITGFGGFRFEDTIAVYNNKAERLTFGLNSLSKS